jgi:sirohydrochlorin cobaltochelatase
MTTQGLLLFAHGARDPLWARPFERVAAALTNQHPGVLVKLAYLELMTPSLADATGELIAKGCTQIDVLPLFLGAGGHVRRDLPLLVQAAQAAHPGCAIRLHPPLGESDAMVSAIAAWAATPLNP